MKNLGKILFFILLVPSVMFAEINATLDYNKITVGEMVTLSLKVSGKDIQRPLIRNICGTNVISTASQTNIEMINGDYSRSKIFSFTFMPQKSCHIDPITLTIDGKKESSNPLDLKVGVASQNTNADFVLALGVSKKEVFVGEPFTLTLTFKQKRGAEVVDSKFIAPDLKGFWVKSESKPEQSRDGNYVVTTIKYVLAPQRSGDLHIKPAQMAIASRAHKRDSWGAFMPQIRWRSYFSNELSLKAKPLPNNAKLVGNFTINASVDKTQINANEAVNLTVSVVGKGNLEDIESFKPYIPGVSVFDEKAVIKGDTLTQKIALVADNNFTIPSFSVAFYNLKTKRVEKITTKEIPITVHNAQPTQALKIKKAKTPVAKVSTKNEKEGVFVSAQSSILIFVAGVFVGVLLMLIRPKNKREKKQKFDFKDEKQLLMKLLPYKENMDVQNIIDTIEGNLYLGKKETLVKKEVKEILEKYNIS